MGQGESRKEEILKLNKIDPNQWKIYQTDGSNQYATDSQGREGQISLLKLDPSKNIDDQLEVYNYRKKVDRPLVKCYGAQPMNNKSDYGICGAGNTIKVITERVVKRWIELPQLTFPEILHALQQSLKGYYTLFKQVGPFQVNSNMIGINKYGDLLVWLNKNFAENNPSLERKILYATGQDNLLNEVESQNQMVRNIMNVVQQRCQQGRYPGDFKKLTQRMINQNVDFTDALNTIKNYARVKNIDVVQKIHPDSKKMYTFANAQVQSSLYTPKKTQDFSFPSYLPKKDEFVSYNYINKSGGKIQPLITPKNTIVQQKFQSNSGFVLGTPKQLIKPSANYVVKQRFTNDLRQNPNINTTDSILYQGSPSNTQSVSPVVNKTPTVTQTITGPTPVTFTNPSLLAGLPTTNNSIINNYNVGTSKINQFGITPITFSASGSKMAPSTFTNFETKDIKKGLVTFGYDKKPQGQQIQTSQVTRQF